MDDYEIMYGLNRLLNLGDAIDNTGVVGVRALSNGKYTTREVCRLELSQFLLYIANGNGTLTEGEAALINIVLGEDYSPSELQQLASDIDAPSPSSSLTLLGFLTGDEALSQQKGYRTTDSTDALINVFEAYGNLMVAFDENPVSKARCIKYISGMKDYVMKNL